MCPSGVSPRGKRRSNFQPRHGPHGLRRVFVNLTQVDELHAGGAVHRGIAKTPKPRTVAGLSEGERLQDQRAEARLAGRVRVGKSNVLISYAPNDQQKAFASSNRVQRPSSRASFQKASEPSSPYRCRERCHKLTCSCRCDRSIRLMQNFA